MTLVVSLYIRYSSLSLNKKFTYNISRHFNISAFKHVFYFYADSPVTVNVPPPSSPSAADRFSSPIHPSQAKRRLFDATSSGTSGATPSAGAGSSVPSIPRALITDKSGRQVCASMLGFLQHYNQYSTNLFSSSNLSTDCCTLTPNHLHSVMSI